MSNFNLAIIGLGQWGQKIVEIFNSYDDINVKYIYSRNQLNNGVILSSQLVSTINPILEDKLVKVVFVATSVDSHYYFVNKLISKDIIILEKPSFSNYAEFLMIDEKNRKKIFTNYIYYYSRGINEFSKLLDGNVSALIINLSQTTLNNDNVVNNFLCHALSILVLITNLKVLDFINDDSIILLDNNLVYIRFKFENVNVTIICNQNPLIKKRRYIYSYSTKLRSYINFEDIESRLYRNYDTYFSASKNEMKINEKDNLYKILKSSMNLNERKNNLTFSMAIQRKLDYFKLTSK